MTGPPTFVVVGECSTHFEIVDIQLAIISFILIPPIRHTVTILVGIQTVLQAVTIGIDVNIIATIPWRPSGQEEPVEFWNIAAGDWVCCGIKSIVIKDEALLNGKRIHEERHVPVFAESVGVLLRVIASINGITVARWIVSLVELIVDVSIDKTTVTVVWIIQIVNPIIIIIPINIVFQTVTIDV